MTEQLTCDLFFESSQSLWKKPLNWDLIMTAAGEERIPFETFVRPNGAQSSTFLLFDRLPAELQFRIIAYCSAPTLFQLMRVSSSLRTEAAKLFWADPSIYYSIDSDWLFEGGHPGGTDYELPFLAQVQNVEVVYSLNAEYKIESLARVVYSQNEMVREFWKTLRKRCPKARKVLINQNWLSRTVTAFNGPFSRALEMLITALPPDIDVSLSRHDDKLPDLENPDTTLPADIWPRSFYQYTLDGNWEKITPYPARTTISVPVKEFRGPVGTYRKVWHLDAKFHLQRVALNYLIIEAIDRYHFDNGRLEPFSCPGRACNGYFEKAGQWTLHAARTHHNPNMIENRLARDAWLRLLPDEIKEAFERHDEDILRRNKELAGEVRRILHEWNEEGPEKKRDIEKAWMDQLENDEAWATETEARKSGLWKRFTTTMDPDWWNSWFARYRDR